MNFNIRVSLFRFLLTVWSCWVPVSVQDQPVSLLLSLVTRCLCVKLLLTLLTLYETFLCFSQLLLISLQHKCLNLSAGTTLATQRTSNSLFYSGIGGFLTPAPCVGISEAFRYTPQLQVTYILKALMGKIDSEPKAHFRLLFRLWTDQNQNLC